MEEKSVVTMTYQTPCGELLLGTNSGALIQADWVDGWHEATVRARLNRYLGNPEFISGTDPVLQETASQLDDYFAGKRRTFDLPLRFLGTEFQTAVWDALTKIPFGRVTTLWRNRGSDRETESDAGGWDRGGREPVLHHRAVPPRGGTGWQSHGVRRRV